MKLIRKKGFDLSKVNKEIIKSIQDRKNHNTNPEFD